MVFRTLGIAGRAQADVASVTYMLVPDTVTMHGHIVEPTMSFRSPIAVQMIDSARAVATGDFAVVATRVDPLLDALAGTASPRLRCTATSWASNQRSISFTSGRRAAGGGTAWARAAAEAGRAR